MHCIFLGKFHQHWEKNMLFAMGKVPIFGPYYRRKKSPAIGFNVKVYLIFHFFSLTIKVIVWNFTHILNTMKGRWRISAIALDWILQELFPLLDLKSFYSNVKGMNLLMDPLLYSNYKSSKNEVKLFIKDSEL